MSSAANLERKRFNLQRLKERAEQEEKERLASQESTANKSNDDSDSQTDEGNNSAKKKLICRSLSSTSNASNVEGTDFDADMAIEEGSWYDVFHDEAGVHEAMARTNVVTPDSKTPVRPLRSSSKSPVASREVSHSGDKPKRDIENIRRRLSCTGAPTDAIPKSKLATVRVHSPTVQKKKSPPSKATRKVSSDEKKPLGIMSKIFSPGGQTSPKNEESMNLVSLSNARTKDGRSPHTVDDKDQSRFSPSNTATNTFLHIRSHIDEQLFNN